MGDTRDDFDVMKAMYWKLFYFLWTPIRLIASALWLCEAIPLGRFAPYVLGASLCRWPQKAEIPEK